MQIINENNTLKFEIEHFNPVHTCLRGQCMRLNEDGGGLWSGIVSGERLSLSLINGICTFYDMTEQEFFEVVMPYLDFDTDYGRIKEELSDMDEHLKRAVSFGSGLRLLRQDLWEVLLSFLISQNNGVPRIKQIVESLSIHFGKPIPGENGCYEFPEPSALADAPVEDINICRGGYRCRYISGVAKRIQQTPSLLTDLTRLPKESARELLLSFQGIGKKVADCILLYSGIDRSVFPVDRWIKRVMEALYFKRETDESTIREFAQEYFGDLAGIAQQYLFYYARENKIGL